MLITEIDGHPVRMPGRLKPRPRLADPDASWWTYRDLAAFFGRADIARQVRHWRQHHNFPVPLPWSRQQRRWRPGPVIAWAARQEAGHG